MNGALMRRSVWMKRRSVWLTGLTLLAGCTSNPTAPVNQVWPIPQMDRAFGDPHPQVGGQPEASDYTRRPGYLPAYPPYDDYRPYPPGISAESSPPVE
jgi:hypothetical protein